MQLYHISDLAELHVRKNVSRFSDIIKQLKVDVCDSTSKCDIVDFFFPWFWPELHLFRRRWSSHVNLCPHAAQHWSAWTCMYCSSLSYFLLKQDRADVSSTYFRCCLYHCLYSFLLICSKIVAGWYLLSESTGGTLQYVECLLCIIWTTLRHFSKDLINKSQYCRIVFKCEALS